MALLEVADDSIDDSVLEVIGTSDVELELLTTVLEATEDVDVVVGT